MSQDFDDSLLDFALPTSARGGRKTKVLSIEVVRELGPQDLDLILNPQPLASTAPAVKSIRHSHHQLARLLAEGHKPGLCSSMTGYSPSRISILQADPAFKELVAYYCEQKDEVFIDVQKRLAALGIDTIEELHERLGTNPEGFSNKDLFALAELTLDRSVAPSKRAENGPMAPQALPNISIQFLAPGAELPASGSTQTGAPPSATFQITSLSESLQKRPSPLPLTIEQEPGLEGAS